MMFEALVGMYLVGLLDMPMKVVIGAVAVFEEEPSLFKTVITAATTFLVVS